MRKVLQVSLGVLGSAAVVISLMHVALGPAAIPGSIPVNATMDSEDRFYATMFLAFGVALLSCVPRIERKAGRAYFLMTVFFLGGVARLISLFFVGPPHSFFILMTAIELTIPLMLAYLIHRTVNRAALGMDEDKGRLQQSS